MQLQRLWLEQEYILRQADPDPAVCSWCQKRLRRGQRVFANLVVDTRKNGPSEVHMPGGDATSLTCLACHRKKRPT